jgi:hypothetical protein
VVMKERMLMTRTEYSILKKVLKYDECGWSKATAFGRDWLPCMVRAGMEGGTGSWEVGWLDTSALDWLHFRFPYRLGSSVIGLLHG